MRTIRFWRPVLFALALCLVVAFFVFVFPRCRQPRGEALLYVAMIEKLRSPGLLARDLVATHPILRDTILDEVSLALARLEVDLLATVVIQQGLALFVAAAGAYRFARAYSVPPLFSLVPAAAGVVVLAMQDATPQGISLALTTAAISLAADYKVLLAGLVGGLALLYAPITAALFWLPALIAAIRTRAFRPYAIALTIFTLLSLNLAQLQAGAPAVAMRGDTFRQWWALLGQHGLPLREGWLMLAAASVVFAVIFRLHEKLHPRAVAFLFAVPLVGLLAIPVSVFLRAINEPPYLAIDLLTSAERLLCAAAAVIFAIAFCSALKARLVAESLVVLAAGAAFVVVSGSQQFLNVPVPAPSRDFLHMAEWAQKETWGSAVFAMDGDTDGVEPSLFRVQAIRAVFLDDFSRSLMRYSFDFALQWQDRRDHYHQRHRQEPIDYYIRKAYEPGKRDMAAQFKPVYERGLYAVYDSETIEQFRRQADGVLWKHSQVKR